MLDDALPWKKHLVPSGHCLFPWAMFTLLYSNIQRIQTRIWTIKSKHWVVLFVWNLESGGQRWNRFTQISGKHTPPHSLEHICVVWCSWFSKQSSGLKELFYYYHHLIIISFWIGRADVTQQIPGRGSVGQENFGGHQKHVLELFPLSWAFYHCLLHHVPDLAVAWQGSCVYYQVPLEVLLLENHFSREVCFLFLRCCFLPKGWSGRPPRQGADSHSIPLASSLVLHAAYYF